MNYEQDINQPVKYFVGLYDDLPFAPWGTVSLVALGVPSLEPEGVENRRFKFAHRFDQTDIDDLNSRGAAHGMAVYDSEPVDWRA